MTHQPVVVVGGGVVGLCTAYYLARAGLPVEVAERGAIGSGASRGNVGWVCLSHSTLVPAPGVLRYAVRSLGRPESPLYLRLLPDPAFLRWLPGSGGPSAVAYDRLCTWARAQVDLRVRPVSYDRCPAHPAGPAPGPTAPKDHRQAVRTASLAALWRRAA